jgi:hypothetical protein
VNYCFIYNLQAAKKHQDDAVKEECASALNSDALVLGVNDLPLDLLADHIFAFVGGGQYFLVGGVSKSFEEAYGRRFPEKTTYCNLSSI